MWGLQPQTSNNFNNNINTYIHTERERERDWPLCERRQQCGEQNGEENDEREVDVGLVGTGS